MSQQLPQFIHQVVERLQSIEGIEAIANSLALCPQDYQKRVELVFALLATAAKLIIDAIAILEGIEQDLSQWYGAHRLVM